MEVSSVMKHESDTEDRRDIEHDEPLPIENLLQIKVEVDEEPGTKDVKEAGDSEQMQSGTLPKPSEESPAHDSLLQDYLLQAASKVLAASKAASMAAARPPGKIMTCATCERTFTKRSNLVAHMVIHSGTRPFNCQICQVTFARRCDLRRHNLSHADLKAFCCQLCGMRFNRACSLKRHLLVHNGPKVHVCPTCGKSFTIVSLLNSHKKIHTDVRPYSCRFCDMKFTLRTYLNRHEVRKHLSSP